MPIDNNIISSLGAGSGIDSKSIVEQLVEIEQTAKLAPIEAKREKYEAQISDYGLMRSALSLLQDSADLLSDPDSFGAKNATFTDSSSLIPTALENNAAVGDYTFEVNAIAAAQSLATDAVFAATTDAVGRGVLTFSFGEWDAAIVPPAVTPDPPEVFTVDTSKDAFSITIDDSNNSLIGLRDAINDADQGVQASIINDGSGNRLVITSASGATNELQITVAEDGATPTNTDADGLSRFAFAAGVGGANQQMVQNQAGADAELVVNGLALTRSSNSIDDVIDGFEFSLASASPGEVMTVNIFDDTVAAEDSVRGFVDAFNAFLEAIEPLTGYNEELEENGSLYRDSTSRTMISSIRNTIASAIPGLDEGFTSLAAIGVRTDLQGNLTIDEDTFTAAFEDNFELVKSLFAPETSSSNSAITVNGFGPSSVPGSYDVVISQSPVQGELIGTAVDDATLLSNLLTAPTRASVTGAGATVALSDFLPVSGSSVGDTASTTIPLNLATLGAGANDYDYSLTIDGVASAAAISLPVADYASYDDMAVALQTAINADANLSGVSVSYDTDHFVVSSGTSGTSSTVSMTALGVNAADLGLDDGVATTSAGSGGVNDFDFSISVDGNASGTISLTPGSYSSYDDLAAEIQAQINADAALLVAGSAVDVSYSGGEFVIASRLEGAASSITEITPIGALAGSLGLDAAATPTVTAGTGQNYDFTIRVDGTDSGVISLTSGSYDVDTLAAHIQSQINSDSALSAVGADVDVVWNTDHFEITSRAYGTRSNVSVTAVGAEAGDLGLAAGAATPGINVAGTINGEPGFGVGNVLLPALNTDPAGLSMVIDPSATTSTINFSGGFGREMSKLIESFLQSSGILDGREDSLNQRLERLDNDEERVERRISAYQARLEAQFLAMERIVSSINGSGSYLDGILDRLPYTAKSQ